MAAEWVLTDGEVSIPVGIPVDGWQRLPLDHLSGDEGADLVESLLETLEAVEQWEGTRRAAPDDTHDTLLTGEAWYVEQGLIDDGWGGGS